MGGDTTVYEALRIGLGVVGRDINPMSWWLVRPGVERLDVARFSATAEMIWHRLTDRIGALYETACLSCGNHADVKYFLWVKTCACPGCGELVDLSRDIAWPRRCAIHARFPTAPTAPTYGNSTTVRTTTTAPTTQP